jgi:hypothetical protein
MSHTYRNGHDYPKLVKHAKSNDSVEALLEPWPRNSPRSYHHVLRGIDVIDWLPQPFVSAVASTLWLKRKLGSDAPVTSPLYIHRVYGGTVLLPAQRTGIKSIVST